MAKTIVNLISTIVVAEVEKILNEYPPHPYQQAFSIPDLRQKLVSYVLTRIPCQYAVLDEVERPLINSQLLHHSLEQQYQIKALIHQGIHHIVGEDSEWIDHHIPQPMSAGSAPSNWFG